MWSESSCVYLIAVSLQIRISLGFSPGNKVYSIHVWSQGVHCTDSMSMEEVGQTGFILDFLVCLHVEMYLFQEFL